VICPDCEFENAASLSECARCGSGLSERSARLVPDKQTDVSVFKLVKTLVTIGRSPENDFCLEDPSVSRLHARIRAAEDGYVIEDNASRHGTTVNGHRVDSHRLQAGDAIKIGVYRFRFADREGLFHEAITLERKEIDHLRLLLDATRFINSPMALEDVLDRIIDSVIEVTRAERGFLLMFDQAGELEFKVARSMAQTELDAEQLAISFSPVDRVRSTGESIISSDIRGAESAIRSPSARRLGLSSVMCVPLKVESRLIGVIYVDSREEIKRFSEKDLWLFESLASQAALALEKCRLYDELRKHSTTLEEQVRERTASLADANENLKKAYAELQQAQARIVQTEKLLAIGRLAAGITHEINTPVGVMNSGIRTLYEALKRLESRMRALPAFDELNEELEIEKHFNVFQQIHKASNEASTRIQNVVGALKNLVSLDQAERRPMDINEALEETLTLLQHEIETRIRVVRRYGTLGPFNGSPARLRQAFLNVLLNAIQAIDSDGEVRVVTDQVSGQVKVRIEDNGRGMSPEQIERLFDPGFTQKDGRVKTALGLAIALQIVREHDGDIQIESQPDLGTKVTFTFPKDRPASA